MVIKLAEAFLEFSRVAMLREPSTEHDPFVLPIRNGCKMIKFPRCLKISVQVATNADGLKYKLHTLLSESLLEF